MQLIRFEAAKRALAEANSIDEVKDVRDKAEALRLYMRQAGESLEMQNAVAEIKIRAERKAGELLKDMDRAKPGDFHGNQHDSGESRDVTKRTAPTLDDIGITRMQSSRWQSVADIPEDKFEQHIETMKTAQNELTSSSVLRLAREVKNQSKTPYAPPDGVFQVLYADPPWQYNNTGVSGAANNHYPTMPLVDIMSLLKDQAIHLAPNGALFMWVTNPFLRDAFAVVDAWGFDYKTNIVWIKTDLQKTGMGFYVRGVHELLFICTRGSFTPLDKHISPPISSVIHAPIQVHSRKPDEVYEIIERLYPNTTRLELFARNKNRAGWEFWGNE